MRKESDQAARALVEQSRAMKDMIGGTQNIVETAQLYHRSNRQHSAAAARVLAQAARTYGPAIEGNARSAKTHSDGTGDLTRHVEALTGALGRRGGNGAQRSRMSRDRDPHD